MREDINCKGTDSELDLRLVSSQWNFARGRNFPGGFYCERICLAIYSQAVSNSAGFPLFNMAPTAAKSNEVKRQLKRIILLYLLKRRCQRRKYLKRKWIRKIFAERKTKGEFSLLIHSHLSIVYTFCLVHVLIGLDNWHQGFKITDVNCTVSIVRTLTLV